MIDSETKENTLLQQGHCKQQLKTLGFLESPAGNHTQERRRLLTKAKTIACIIATNSFNTSEAHAIHRCYYIPMITYSFTVGTFTLKECEQIQRPVIAPLIQAHRYPKSMPREVVFGPTDRLGIGIRHLFTEHGAIKITTILKIA